MSESNFQQCQSDHSIFIHHSSAGSVIKVVYVDILLSRSDIDGIEKVMAYLKTHFVTKDTGRHRYFLENEISHNI